MCSDFREERAFIGRFSKQGIEDYCYKLLNIVGKLTGEVLVHRPLNVHVLSLFCTEP